MFLQEKNLKSRCGDTHDELCVEGGSVGHSQGFRHDIKPLNESRGILKRPEIPLLWKGRDEAQDLSYLPQTAFADSQGMHRWGHFGS